ncbi:phosphatase PAP2 family protein [Lysinibacillus telephonicus]|nr:phosphatase PAP2 family protein [Lysinibacillus telephonicus]
MTYESPFIQALDTLASNLLYGVHWITMFHYFGETKFIFVISFIVLIFIGIRKRDYKLMLFVFMNVGIGFGLYQFLKYLIERPRPDIIDQFSTFSFPSGHALHGLVYLLTIAYVFDHTSDRVINSKKNSRTVWITAIILILFIGLSRITEGRHYASDVLAGWMLGYSWFILSVWWYEQGNPLKNKKF